MPLPNLYYQTAIILSAILFFFNGCHLQWKTCERTTYEIWFAMLLLPSPAVTLCYKYNQDSLL